jgi:hypothetical protein
MPYHNEHSTGESLLRLENSAALREFNGIISSREQARDPLLPLDVSRRNWLPQRVIAIDGSNLLHRVRNGFPGAEAGLIQISVVSIDVTQLAMVQPHEIPRPSVFHSMERATTLDAVLPGANIVRKDRNSDSPRRFFRATVFDALSSSISLGHETLLETYRAVIGDRSARIRCPIEGCDREASPSIGQSSCLCGKETLFETDALRIHERFQESGANGEVHGEVRHVLEVLVLLNILRFFAKEQHIHFLRDCAFILDGPLAIFGHPAWMTPFVRQELLRINAAAHRINGVDAIVLGIEKSGQFVSHFDELDWCDTRGNRGKFPAQSAFALNDSYIKRNIVLRDEASKPHGQDTYFGRKIFYKTLSGDHAVINVAMLNDRSADFMISTLDCYPRLGDVLTIFDHLSTYLYQDGFMPLIRAHAHAAIPLTRGADIISSLFSNQNAPAP